MGNNNLRMDLEVAAHVTGQETVAQLTDRLDDAAVLLGGELKDRAAQASAELRRLAEQDAAIQAFLKLKSEAASAAKALRDIEKEATNYGKQITAIGPPTEREATALQKLRDAAGAASTKLEQQQQALAGAGADLQRYGIAAQNTQAAQARLAQQTQAVRDSVQDLVPAYQSAASGAAASAAKQVQATKQVESGLDSLKGQLNSLRNIAAAALGGSFVGSLAKDVADTADAYNNLQARIKLVTGEGPLFEAAFERITAVASRTSSSLESTGTLFTKLADAGKSAGLGTQAAIDQALKLTETVNQAVQLSGASAQASDAAITQLIQGLQGGVLRGDEFNSVMEQSPRLARALADGLGTTTGELRKMAEAGQLSSETVIKALQGQADTVASEFSKLPPTVGRALQNLSTSWTLYVGETDKATGASAAAATAISALSTHLKTVAGFLLDAGQAAAALVALRLAQYFLGVGAAAATATTAVVANTAAVTAAGAAGSAAAVGVGRFAAILSTLKTFTLLGIITNFHDIGTAIGEGLAKLAGYKDKTDELARADQVAAQIANDAAAARKRMVDGIQTAIDKQFELSTVAKSAIAEFDKLTKEGTNAAEAVAKIGKDFDLATIPGIRNATAVLDKLAADGKISATEFQTAWGDALKGADLAVFEVQARAAFAGTAREAERLGQILDATLRESIKRTGLDFDVISGGMGRAARSAINDTDAMIAGLDKLKAMGVDTAQVLTASIGKGISTADSQKAIEAVRLQIESLRKQLGDKLTDGLLDQAKLKANELVDALDKAKPGINSLREAMAELGLKSRDELQRTADKANAAYDVIKASGQAEGESYVAWQARKSEAGRVMLERLIAANGGVVTEAIKARAAMEGIELAAGSAGRGIQDAMRGGSNAVTGFTQHVGANIEELRRMETALDAINAKYGQSKGHRDGTFKLDEQTKATPGRIDLSLATKILDATKTGRPVDMTAAELKQAQEQAKAAFEAVQAAMRNSPGLVSFDAMRSAEELYRAAMSSRLVNVTDKSGSTSSGKSTQDLLDIQRRVEAEANASGTNRTVNVKITLPNGSVQTVPTTDDGASALIKALQDAKLSAGL